MFTKRNLLVLFGKHMIIGFSAIIISGIIVFFLSSAIEKITNSVVTNHQLVEKLGKRTDFYALLERDATYVGNNMTTIENSFVPSDNISEFVYAMKSLALKNGVTQSYRFGSPTTTSLPAPFEISSIEYQNSISMNIFSLIKYLKDFEVMPYSTKIDSLSFTSQDSAGWRGNGTISYRAILYTKTNK